MTYKHVQIITKTGPDGAPRTYRYHRKARVRIFAEPGTPAFDAEYAAIQGGIIPRREYDPPWYVYFIQGLDGSPIKIGRALNPEQRLKDLQVGHTDALRILAIVYDPKGRQFEAELHERFKSHKIRGEWFRPAPEIADFIAAHGRPAGWRVEMEGNEAGTGLQFGTVNGL